MLPQVMPGVTVTRVYPASEIAALMSPGDDAGGEVLALEQRAADALTTQGCGVAVRQFPSSDLPAVFIERGQVIKSFAGYEESAHLVLNWDNRVVKALANTADDVIFDRVTQVLYVQARMAGGCETADDRALLSAALDDVLLVAVGIDGKEPEL